MPKRLLPVLIVPFMGLVSCQKETQVEKANREGILLFGNSAEPKALDPHLVTGVVESKVIGSLFEGLASDHPSDDAGNNPGAATHWDHNEDLTEWTFHLQPEGKWSDGEPVTADDFVYAYNRILNPELDAPYAAMLHYMENAEVYNKNLRGEILFSISPPEAGPPWEEVKEANFAENKDDAHKKIYDKIWKNLETDEERRIYVNGKGLDDLKKAALEWIKEDVENRYEWPEGYAHGPAVIDRLSEYGDEDLFEMAKVGALAPDEKTLRVKLREPVPFLPSLTRHYTWFPVPKHVVEKFYVKGERFTDWCLKDNIVGNGPFKLKEWRYHDFIEVERNPHYWDAENVGLNGVRFIPIENEYTEARAFRAGQLHTTSKFPQDQLNWAKENIPDSLRQDPYVSTQFIRFNINKEALDKMKVRQALSLAINCEDLCEHIMDGYTAPTSLTPRMGEYLADPVIEFNPEKAKKLLAEAGYPDGEGFPRLSIMVSKDSPPAEAIQAMWKEHLGILVDIRKLDWGSFNSAHQSLEYEISLSGWVGDYLDPTTFLDMWTKGNGNNNTGWSSEAYEALLKKAAQQSDPSMRYKVLAEAENLFLEERPIAPVAWAARNYLHRPEVKGWHPLLLDNHPLKAITLEP